jgi:NADH-quinone oxidoreductase subunit F
MRELPLTKNIDLNRGPLSLKEYEQAGGYSAFRKALKMAPADITALVQQAGLREEVGPDSIQV